MTEFTVEEGDFKKLVAAEEADDDYQIDVLQGRGRLVHSRALAAQGDGKRVLPGDRPTIRNLDGKPLYAVATGSSDLRLDVSGTSFTAELQQSAEATIGNIEANDPEVIANQEEIINLLTQIEENTRA